MLNRKHTRVRDEQEAGKGKQFKKGNTRRKARWLVSVLLKMAEHDCLKERPERPGGGGGGRYQRNFSKEMLHVRA